jgi:hypothetical protein
VRHWENERARQIMFLLYKPPYSLGPVAHRVADYAAEHPAGAPSFQALMISLAGADDAELLEIEGVGPAGVRKIRAAVRTAAGDPWLAHARALCGWF